MIMYQFLVGGFNPFEKYARQNGNLPQIIRGENTKYLKPPPRLESMKLHDYRFKTLIIYTNPERKLHALQLTLALEYRPKSQISSTPTIEIFRR